MREGIEANIFKSRLSSKLIKFVINKHYDI